jgi:hypothetical protein
MLGSHKHFGETAMLSMDARRQNVDTGFLTHSKDARTNEKMASISLS